MTSCAPVRLRLLHRTLHKPVLPYYLPHSSKIFEKILKEKIVNFLNKYNVLSESQFGFQKKSTNEALIELENYLKYQQANSQITCGIFLDLKKAFDTVDHNILKKKTKK